MWVPPPGSETEWDSVLRWGASASVFLTPSIVFLVEFLTLRGWC